MSPPARSIRRSQELYERALARIPGATQLLSRRPQIFAPGVAPIYAARGRGSHIEDVDGNDYLDYGMSVSACILGYADPVVTAAVRDQLDDGVMYSLNHPAEIELAELLIETIPCAEMVRYAKGGGEAAAIAVRIARGVTGRDKVLFCGYHGWHDWYLAANLKDESSLDAHLFPGIEPIGVPRSLAGTAVPFPFGDAGALAALADEYRDEVACVIMEPMRSDLPAEGYLEAVRQVTAQRGIVLVFDEVTTGFRHAVGGVEERVGVVPDMAIFAKSLSNGFAMGAVVGRESVMEPAARMFISSTNWSDLVGITAATATLREVRRRDVPRLLADYGEALCDGFNHVAGQVGVDARMIGLAAFPRIEFAAVGEATSEQMAALFAQEMASRGILINAHPVHSAAHTEDDLAQTFAAARPALETLARAAAENRVLQSLVVEPAGPLFRRLVT